MYSVVSLIRVTEWRFIRTIFSQLIFYACLFSHTPSLSSHTLTHTHTQLVVYGACLFAHNLSARHRRWVELRPLLSENSEIKDDVCVFVGGGGGGRGGGEKKISKASERQMRKLAEKRKEKKKQSENSVSKISKSR